MCNYKKLRYVTFFFFFFFWCTGFEIWYVFYAYKTSPFELATFQMLKSHTLQLATTMPSAGLEGSRRIKRDLGPWMNLWSSAVLLALECLSFYSKRKQLLSHLISEYFVIIAYPIS